MPKTLKRIQFGNQLLRKSARRLKDDEIKSAATQKLIKDMFYTLETKKHGVGLAAPQVGHSIALAVINLRTTPAHPNTKKQRGVYINPRITKHYGKQELMWEGCISMGAISQPVFAQVKRFKKIEIYYLDVNGQKQTKVVSGFAAHVLQHEVDHLNGVLFVDRVEDPKSFINLSEYKKRLRAEMRTKKTTQ
jgi:peptide deformylase